MIRRLKQMHEDLKQQVAAGEITEEEAEQRMREVKEGLHERHDMPFGERPQRDDLRVRIMRELEARIHEARDRIHADLDAGLITEEEAERQMEDVHRELREGLMHRIHERPEGARKKCRPERH